MCFIAYTLAYSELERSKWPFLRRWTDACVWSFLSACIWQNEWGIFYQKHWATNTVAVV